MIAVVLSVYKNDSPLWLKESINSILEQKDVEIKLFIGVDGNVSDSLNAVISGYRGLNNVHIIRFKENRGLACVLNDLIDIALEQGSEYIARMDADDISMPIRFAHQVRFLEMNPTIDVVGGAIEEIDEDGHLCGKTIFYPVNNESCRRFFSKRNPHAHPAVMFRRSFFEKLQGKKYRPEYRQNQDTMLWYDGMMAGTTHANIPEVVLQFRVTESMFSNRRNGWAFAKKQFEDRLMINRGLGYGWKADIYGFAMFCVLVSPVWVKKIAYKVFR